MRMVEKLVTLVILTVTFGGLIGMTLFGSGADDVTLLCFGSVVFSLFVVIAACIMVQDKRRAVMADVMTGGTGPGKTETFINNYKSKMAIRLGMLALIGIGVVLLALYSISVGPNNITVSDVARLLYLHITDFEFEVGTDDWFKDIMIWEVRLPRVLVALIAGAGLAIGGAVMQAVVKNPLADPFTTGISSGAVFGASLFIVLGFTVSGIGHYGLVANAFLFSLIPALILVVISRLTNSSPVTVILVGTAVSYIFSSLNTLIMMIADQDALKEAFVWSVGSLSGVTWNTIPLMFIITTVFSFVLYLASNKLNLLMSGDNEAKSLGLNVDNFRIFCLLVISLITASIVAYIGVIGFVGLIVPHFVRLIMGSDSRLVIPASILTGAAAMVGADILSRMLASSALPVGVVLSFVGGPLFLLLIMKSRKEAWVDEV